MSVRKQISRPKHAKVTTESALSSINLQPSPADPPASSTKLPRLITVNLLSLTRLPRRWSHHQDASSWLGRRCPMGSWYPTLVSYVHSQSAVQPHSWRWPSQNCTQSQLASLNLDECVSLTLRVAHHGYRFLDCHIRRQPCEDQALSSHCTSQQPLR